MDRRGFLSSILALGAAPAIVRIESLMPVRATIEETLAFGGNRLLTLSEISAQALEALNEQLKEWSYVNDQYDAFFGKIGSKVNVRRPLRFVESLA